MSVVIDGTSGITTPAETVNGPVTATGLITGATNYTGFKNRIINGNMAIDQRNAGASVIPATGAYYNLDRFYTESSQSSKFSVQQNAGAVTPPAGFSKYLGITSLSAYAVLVGDYFTLEHRIEGFNFADMQWGTANAKTVTLSFQVYSSLTGTFGGALQNGSDNRSYPFSYSIPVANTWTTISITIAGDTTGTWVGATNGIGVGLVWGLGVGGTYGSGTANAWANSLIFVPTGSTSVVGTNGATFYITGVQLEKGSTATSFDYRPYGTELALCQRYFVKYGGNALYEYVSPYGATYVSTVNFTNVVFPVEMRAAPSVSGGTLLWSWQGSSVAVTSVQVDKAGTKVFGVQVNTGGGETSYRPGLLFTNNSLSGFLSFSAEL